MLKSMAFIENEMILRDCSRKAFRTRDNGTVTTDLLFCNAKGMPDLMCINSGRKFTR